MLEVLKVEEVEKFLETIPCSTELEVRDRAMFEILYSCGLRVSELVNLRLQNIDFDEIRKAVSDFFLKDIATENS